MQIKINKIFDYAAIASGLILFFLAILTFCDVFGRRFLNSPVAGTIEIVEFGIALVAFLNNNRVTIDLELSFYPFYFASAIAMWLSVLAIILWFINAISERENK